MEKKVLIITGGTSNVPFQKAYMKGKEYTEIIAADGGIETAIALGVKPNVLLGDFDSINPAIYDEVIKSTETKVIAFPPEKDDTDTQLAIQEAINRGASYITIFGATGTRLDHVLANIGLLTCALNQGVNAEIVDTNNRIYAINKEICIEKTQLFGKYVSLIPYTDTVYGVSLRGFKYPLTNDTLTKGNSLGISNEVVSDQAFISLEKGILLVIESRD